MQVSAHASAQAPTKLGLKPNEMITVEEAIKAIVTRSANDAAVVVAEAIAGSEPTFAVLMTDKAQMLGMVNTVYVNASGLPAEAQITTAREQALLGRAIQERFPEYSRYFAISSIAASRSVITMLCCGKCRASTVSRPAIPRRRVITWSPRCAVMVDT
jgi:D-alanyl-D-alanine carboxypeptidase